MSFKYKALANFNFSDDLILNSSFSSDDEINNLILSIFRKEIKRLVPILNKEFKSNIRLSELNIDLLDKYTEDYDIYNPEELYAIFDPRGNKLFIYADSIRKAWNDPESRPRKIYDSIGNFIKDCACHELFHRVDELIHNYKDEPLHINWWVENYNPHYKDKNTKKFDYRRQYTNKDVIIENERDPESKIDYEVAYFAKVSSPLSKYVICNRESTSLKYELRDKSNKSINYKFNYNLIKSRINREGNYLVYLYQNLPDYADYDIVIAKIPDIFQLKSIGARDDFNLVISIDLLNKYFDTNDNIYLDIILYRLRHKGQCVDIDKLVSELLEYRKSSHKRF